MNLSGLSRRDRRTLVVGALTIAALILLSRGLPAWRRWSADAKASAMELAGEATRVEVTVAGAALTHDSLVKRNARFLALAPRLVDGDTPASAGATLAGVVSGAAATSGMRLSSIQVSADTSRGRVFTRVAVRADVTGDVRGLTTLLTTLERGPLLLAIRELSVTQPELAAPSGRPEALRAQVLVEGLALNHAARGAR